MALRSRGFRRQSAVVPRRSNAWDVGPGNTTPLAVAADGKYLFSGVSPTRDGLTLARTRGELLFFLQTTGAIGDGFNAAFGMGRVTVDAFNVGITAIPGPITDEAWNGWFFHSYLHLHAAGIIGAGNMLDQDAINPTVAAVRMEVDSKAMRKIADEEIFIAVLEVFATGAATAQVSFRSRMLFKLP